MKKFLVVRKEYLHRGLKVMAIGIYLAFSAWMIARILSSAIAFHSDPLTEAFIGVRDDYFMVALTISAWYAGRVALRLLIDRS